MVASVNMKIRARVVPCEGFEMIRIVRGEYLVADKGNRSRNVVIDAGILASVFDDYIGGGPLDEFNHGFGSFWRIEEVVEI